MNVNQRGDMKRRLPAEWEEQDGVLLAWPHDRTDWLPHLEVVESVFLEIAREISRFETVVIVAPDGVDVRGKLQRVGAVMERVRTYGVETNDAWTRDFGPITVTENGNPVLLDFGFNGWGLKYASNLDNQVARKLFGLGAFRSGIPLRTIGMILEGGSIESDGEGTILTTARCLTEANRNPHFTRDQLGDALSRLLGADRILWLENGHLAGDDTDSHIDTLARLCPGNTILHVACDDPSDEHCKPIAAMVEELGSFRAWNGKPYRLIELPLPAPVHDGGGNRLPATYANFLIINGAVLVPTYGDGKDAAALDAVKLAFADREVIGIDCLPLIFQYGSLHCVTMQIPKGVLA